MTDKKQSIVAILDDQFLDEEFTPDVEQGVLKDVAKVDCLKATKVEEIPDRVKEADAILAWHHMTSIGKDTLEKFEKAKVIVRIGMGYDNIDIKAAGELGIRVCNVPDYGVEEVADSAICMMLNMMRKTYVAAQGTKQGHWPTKHVRGATRLAGTTIGIIGLGRIGTAFALRAKSFNTNVVFYDPYIGYGIDKSLSIKRIDSLKELLEISDVISVHVPLKFNDVDNTHLLDEKTFKYVKKGARLVNTARGPVVKESALISALKDGTLSAAALDVFEKEPYPLDGELLKLENVIMTPHSAFYSDEGLVEMRSKAALEAKRTIEGGEPLYCVNRQFLKNPR